MRSLVPLRMTRQARISGRRLRLQAIKRDDRQ
jgi:hypothetical protein